MSAQPLRLKMPGTAKITYERWSRGGIPTGTLEVEMEVKHAELLELERAHAEKWLVRVQFWCGPTGWSPDEDNYVVEADMAILSIENWGLDGAWVKMRSDGGVEFKEDRG